MLIIADLPTTHSSIRCKEQSKHVGFLAHSVHSRASKNLVAEFQKYYIRIYLCDSSLPIQFQEIYILTFFVCLPCCNNFLTPGVTHNFEFDFQNAFELF